MRDKQNRILTDRQARAVRAMSHTWESAMDIADLAEVDNRAIGSVLVSLEKRGLVARQVLLMDRLSRPTLYEWRLV